MIQLALVALVVVTFVIVVAAIVQDYHDRKALVGRIRRRGPVLRRDGDCWVLAKRKA